MHGPKDPSAKTRAIFNEISTTYPNIEGVSVYTYPNIEGVSDYTYSSIESLSAYAYIYICL